MEPIVEELLQRPDLPKYLEEIQKIWNDEQKRRKMLYETMEERSYEFINGEIIEETPNNIEHLRARKLLTQLLNVYVQKHNLGEVFDEKAMVALTRNDYEPDVAFWNCEKSQQFGQGQLLFPAPDLVVEVISKSTEKRDRGVKFEDYAAHGILKYWIVDSKKRLIEQYQLNRGEYKLIGKSKQGDSIESVAVKGFEIPVNAIFDEHENVSALVGILQNTDLE